MTDEREDKDNYEEQRKQKMSDEKKGSEKEGKHQEYDEWNQEDLLQKAGELGIKERSKMNKQELIKAIRDH